MGRCPCFGNGRKKKPIIIRNNKENEDQKPPLHLTNSDKSSSVTPDKKLEQNFGTSVPKDDAIIFNYRELATATNNFRLESLIGEGGFGPVYKGKLETTGQMIAVKKLNHSGLQGEKEFLVEVLMLSLLRHPNLVNLIGYSAEGEQRLLVYEFMPLGSLEDHLHDVKSDLQRPLDWNTRIMIAAGAAKGLNYLHNEADPPVIYRDLKSSNILLDEGFHPKLSDFGLAKFGPKDDKSHVSTRVMGTQGYCAPEYAATGKLTVKSDIYSFGVLLLELITGRRPLDMTRGIGKHNLVDWARPMLKDKRNLVRLADPMLIGQFSEHSLRKAMEVALMCLRDDPHSRPDMNDLVLAMKYLISRKYRKNGDHMRDNSVAELEGERNERLENVGEHTEENLEETRLLNQIKDREQAVAEAKMWGETWRDKSRQNDTNNLGIDVVTM